eukprot:1145065-Pelagomonas_calceolata.AAC.1
MADIGIHSTGLGGNPLKDIAWLAREEARPSTFESSFPIPNPMYFSDLKDALDSTCMLNTDLNMQVARQATTLITKACYLMQTRALAMPSGTCPVSQPKRNTQSSSTAQAPSTTKKYAARFKRSTSLVCPLPECHHMDSTLHILSGCQCPTICNTVTERHNIASRRILKMV